MTSTSANVESLYLLIWISSLVENPYYLSDKTRVFQIPVISNSSLVYI